MVLNTPLYWTAHFNVDFSWRNYNCWNSAEFAESAHMIRNLNECIEKVMETAAKFSKNYYWLS